MKILLIEDQEELADSIRDYLKEEGIICESCNSSFDAQDKMLSSPWPGTNHWNRWKDR
ncbi:MAG: hypothetical protein WD431_07525 [Cyclobacteriaceae bacterium]